MRRGRASVLLEPVGQFDDAVAPEARLGRGHPRRVFGDIPKTRPEDFRIATERVYRSNTRASSITLQVERR